jgi:hypothetical protein
MNLAKWLQGRRKPDEDDLYRPLSEQENELVEHDVQERSGYDEAPAEATPESPVNVVDVSGLDLPLSEGERELVQYEVDEQSGRDTPGTATDGTDSAD